MFAFRGDLPFPLESGENVILSVRRHWVAFWPRFAALLLAGALPAGFILGLLVRTRVVSPVIWRVSLAIIAIWICHFLVRAILCKRSHDRLQHVITDRRVVIVCQAGALRFETSSTILAHISEVRSRARGLLPTVFRYGDVEYRTSDGEIGGCLERVPRPQAIALQLQEACHLARARSGAAAETRHPTQQLRKMDGKERDRAAGLT